MRAAAATAAYLYQVLCMSEFIMSFGWIWFCSSSEEIPGLLPMMEVVPHQSNWKLVGNYRESADCSACMSTWGCWLSRMPPKSVPLMRCSLIMPLPSLFVGSIFIGSAACYPPTLLLSSTNNSALSTRRMFDRIRCKPSSKPKVFQQAALL